MEILDFEKQHNLELTVRERDPEAKDLQRYYASFDNAEIKVGIGCLLGGSGDGNTITEAIKDYCTRISNKTLIIDAMSSTSRREIKVPELQHTQLTLEELFPTKESHELPTDPEKLREALRQIAEHEAAFQQELQKERLHRESSKIPLSTFVVPAEYHNKRLIEILERLASKVENQSPFIHLSGI